MDVTWLGHGCFRLRGRNAAVVTDPYPPAIGLKLQLDPIDRFLKEMGLAPGEALAKLSVQPSSGEYDTKLVLLEPRAEPKG